MTDLKELTVHNATTWRKWLENNHDTSPGVWLALCKKGGKVTELTYAEALDEALCYGWIDGQLRKRDDESYLQRFTPRRPNSSWSVKNVQNTNRLIKAGKMKPAGFAAIATAKARGTWDSPYSGQANMVVPSDLIQALENNPEAQLVFNKLSKLNRYAIVYRLNSLKTESSRKRRLAKYVNMLARGETIYPNNSRKD